MDILSSLLNDRELRGQVSRLLTNKVRADVKSLETNALLSRQLLEAAARRQNGQAVGDGSTLRSVIKEHLDFYESLIEQTLSFNRRLMSRLHGLGVPPSAQNSAPTMRFSAPLGSTARGPFHVENNRSTPIAVRFEITPFVSESGSATVSAEVAFDPPMLELQPGQEGKVELIVVVSQGFAAGEVYFATVRVDGLEGTQLLVRLQVLHDAAGASATAAAPAAPSATTTPRRAAEAAPAPAPGAEIGTGAAPATAGRAGTRRKPQARRRKATT